MPTPSFSTENSSGSKPVPYIWTTHGLRNEIGWLEPRADCGSPEHSCGRLSSMPLTNRARRIMLALQALVVARFVDLFRSRLQPAVQLIEYQVLPFFEA
jgi:hypothetical protein